MIVEFGPWLPDLPPHKNQGLVQAKNCRPSPLLSYQQLNSLQSFTDALTSAALEMFWMNASNGTANVFAGDTGSLYKLNSTGDKWTNESQGGGAPYSVADWTIVSFGDNVVAVGDGETPQFFEVGTSADFADLTATDGGTVPQAKRAGVIRDFLVLGNLTEGGTAYPNRLRWSGFNNIQLWKSSLATQSDFQDLPNRGGAIQSVVSGEEGIIFREYAVWVMTYEGPPNVFRLDEVLPQEGTPAPKSVVRYGDTVFFYENGGFKAYRLGGGGTENIGENRVDQTFASTVGELSTIQGAINRTGKEVYWAYKTSSSLTNPNRLLIYNYGTNRWSEAEMEIQYLGEYVPPSGGVIADDQTGVVADTQTGILMDSIATADGSISITSFNTDNKLCTFEGSPLTATLETREISFDGQRHETNSVRPIIDGSSATVTTEIGYRQTQQSGVTYTSAKGLNSIGEANIRKNARYQRFKLNVSGGFTEAQGIEIRGRMAGRR